MIFRKTPQELTDEEKIRDTRLSLVERKDAFKRIQKQMLNPKRDEDFDPQTFDPLEDHPDYELGKRERKAPPKRLPTMGMQPKEILEGQMVGMFESKQDLYLLFANITNQLWDKIDELEAEVARLKNNPPKKEEKNLNS